MAIVLGILCVLIPCTLLAAYFDRKWKRHWQLSKQASREYINAEDAFQEWFRSSPRPNFHDPRVQVLLQRRVIAFRRLIELDPSPRGQEILQYMESMIYPVETIH